MRAHSRLRHLSQVLSRSSPRPTTHLHATTSTTSPPNSPRAMTDRSSFLDDGVRIVLPSSDLTPSTLRDFIPYKTWRDTLNKSLAAQSNRSHPFHHDPYRLESIEVQSCDFFSSNRLGFLKLRAKVVNGSGQHVPGSVFMRGGSVAMLIVLHDHDHDDRNGEDDHVILTVQPRIPAGSLGFVELPAGMIDDSGTFGGAAAKEIREETGLDVKADELVDMTKLAIEMRGNSSSDDDDDDDDDDDNEVGDEVHLQQGVYPSPGGCDEFIPIFLVRKQMSAQDIQALKGKLTGLRERGEKITLKVCRLVDLWKVGARDGKTLAAVALYEGLKREGRI